MGMSAAVSFALRVVDWTEGAVMSPLALNNILFHSVCTLLNGKCIFANYLIIIIVLIFMPTTLKNSHHMTCNKTFTYSKW